MRPRTLLIAFGVVVLVVVLIGGCGLVVAASSLPSGEHPDVDFRNSEISAARAAVLPELNAQLDGMEARFGRTHVGPRARLDRCEAGADDFTRQDRYAYTCRLAVIELMPVSDPFKRNASLLGEALLEGNCPDGTDTDRALAEPFDHPRQLDSSRGDCTPGFSVPGPEIRRWLTARPTADEVDVATSFLRCRQSYRGEYCDSTPLDVRASISAAPVDTAYVAIVVADESYFHVPWDCPWPASWFRDSCRA